MAKKKRVNVTTPGKYLKQYGLEVFEDTYVNLRQFTAGCKVDMHEPDEQGISAKVKGNHLDNAFGDEGERVGEYVVILKNEQGETKAFNLASLIALARR